MKSARTLERHKRKCDLRHPPGDEVYRDGALSVFEVRSALALAVAVAVTPSRQLPVPLALAVASLSVGGSIAAAMAAVLGHPAAGFKFRVPPNPIRVDTQAGRLRKSQP